MGKIEQTLIKIKSELTPLLVEVFPKMEKEILFAQDDNYKEWFGMLFELHKWIVHPSMVEINPDSLKMSKHTEKKAIADLQGNYELRGEDYGFISTVLINDEVHLIDGYHRVLIARQIGISQLRGCVWTKARNVHPNCDKIKQLIINNL